MASTANPVASPGHPAPARERAGLASLWFGLFGGPVAWAVQTLVNLSLAAHACFPRLEPVNTPVVGDLRGVVFVVSLGALVVTAAATFVAVRVWRRTRHEHQGGAGKAEQHTPETALVETGEGRTRFMALAGVLTSLGFLLISLVHTASIFLVTPCA